MKSWVISLRWWSDGAHHSAQTPQISLYLSSTLIQQNNSPKRLSIFHPSTSSSTLYFISLCYMESWGILFMSCFAPVSVCNQNREGQTVKWNREQIMYISGLFICYTQWGMVSYNITKKHQTDSERWEQGCHKNWYFNTKSIPNFWKHGDTWKYCNTVAVIGTAEWDFPALTRVEL